MIIDGKVNHLRTPSEILDKETNDIMMGVLFGSNSQYSKQLGVDTRRGIREKVMRGEWPTSAPMFYVNYGEEKGSKNIKPNPENYFHYQEWVNRIIDNQLNYQQSWKLLKEMNIKSKNGKYLSKSRVHDILKSPVYCGILKYSDIPETQGKWEPLITEKQWKSLQDVLSRNNKPYQTKWEHAFKTTLRCGECGCAITAYTKTKKSGKQYTYYCCTKKKGVCNNIQMTEEELENQFVGYLNRIRINKTTLDKIKQLAISKLENEHEYEIQNAKIIEKDIEKLTAQLDVLFEMRMNKELEPSEYLSRKNSINEELKNLTTKRSDIRYNREDVRKSLELFIESSFRLEDSFTNGSLQDKRNIIYSVTKDFQMKDGKIGLNFQKPWCDLLEVVSDTENVKWGGRWDLNP